MILKSELCFLLTSPLTVSTLLLLRGLQATMTLSLGAMFIGKTDPSSVS